MQEAEALAVRSRQLFQEGRYAEGVPLAERACAILEEVHGRRSIELAKCINDLGLLYWGQGSYEKAKPLHERALAIRERILGPDHLDVAESLSSLAVLHVKAGKYAEAERLTARSLAIREVGLGPDHVSVAASLHVLAELKERQGNYDEAESLYERALTIRLAAQGEEHPDVGMTLSNLAVVYEARGRYEESEALRLRAVAIFESSLGPSHPYLATSLNNLAVLYQIQGRFEEAEQCFVRASSIFETVLGADHPDFAQSLNNLAMLHQARGDYGRAEPLHERAVATLERALGPDHPEVATSLNNLALMYKLLGEYERAESLFQRALAAREEALGPDHELVAASQHNLAGLHYAKGEYDEAESLYQRALAVKERALGDTHPSVAQSLNDLGNVYRAQGKYERAKPSLERALSIWTKKLGSGHPNVGVCLNNLALLHWEVGEHVEALSLFERALSILERTMGLERTVATRNNIAALYHELGRHDVAVPHHRLSMEMQGQMLALTLAVAEDRRRLDYAATMSHSVDNVLSAHLQAAPDHDSSASLALTVLLRRKGMILDLVTRSNVVVRRSLAQEHVHLLEDLSLAREKYALLANRGPGRLSVESFAAEVAKAQREQDAAWRELSAYSPVVAAQSKRITIEDIQAALPPRSVCVEIIEYLPRYDDHGVSFRQHDPKPPARYAAYLVFPDRFDWVDLGPAAPIDAHVAAFRRALQLEQPIPTDLYRAVMQPILARLPEDTRRLVIAPDGALNLVPFGALFDGERYLVEQYALRYVTTGRDLLPPVRDPVTTSPVTVVANPLGADLSGAELEADVLAGLFPDVRLLRQADATETALRTVERPLVLHMATHGFFGPALHERDNPMLRSGIHLADVDQLEDATIDRELDDGRLTAYEVSGWDLRGTQLVVLSACETGLGALHTGEGVLGPRRAFAMAGAQTQVMSLWQVGDVTTQKLMTAYYRALAGGMGRGEAMQAVQLEMLRTKEHHHPHDWAAFVVTGDDAPMTFPAGQEPAVAHAEDPEPGPPPHRARRGGCSTTGAAPDEGTPAAWLLLGVLGVAARRRRSA